MFNQKYIAPILTSILFILILLWIYTAASKLVDLAEFKRQLSNQTFGKSTASALLWLIPLSELIAATLLLFGRTRFSGLILSALLMFLFSSYIALVLAGYYERVPCSCGGVLKQLGWQAHFWFNLFFLSISAMGIYLERRLKRIVV